MLRLLQLMETIVQARQMSPDRLNLLHDRYELRAGLRALRLLHLTVHEVATRRVGAYDTALGEQLERLGRGAGSHPEVTRDRPDRRSFSPALSLPDSMSL